MVINVKQAIDTIVYKVDENLDLEKLNLTKEEVKDVDYVEINTIDWKKINNVKGEN